MILKTIKIVTIAFFLYFVSTQVSKSFEIPTVEVNSQSTSLVGNWLFTKHDDPSNIHPEQSKVKWIKVKMPLDWTKIYNDGKKFEVAWNAIKLKFDSSLIGKEYSFVWGGIASKYKIYLDGNLIGQQNQYTPHKPLKMINPNINTFKVTKTHHIISVRHTNYVMKAFYGLPFEIREYRSKDLYLSILDFIFKDVVDIASITFLVSFLFFGLVYLQTKSTFYIIPCFISFSTGMAFGFWGGLFAKFIDYYSGIMWLYLFLFPPSLLAMLFMRRIVSFHWALLVLPILSLLCPITIPYFTFIEFHQGTFLIARKFSLAVVNISLLLNVYTGFKVLRKDKSQLPLFIGVIIASLSALQSTLAAFGTGFISIHIGFIFLTGGIVYSAVKNFAKTYNDNEVLLAETQELNENLEHKVGERTAELAAEKNSVSNLLHNMSQAVFSVDIYGKIQGRAMSEFSSIVFGRCIKGENIYSVLFPFLDKSSEKLSNIRTAIETSMGGDELQWDLNKDYIPNKTEIEVNKKRRIISILPNPIWGLNQEVEEVMFTCEDITEKLELEEKVKKNQAESNKRSQVLHELAPHDGKGIAGHSKDLKLLLFNSNKLLKEAIEVMRKEHNNITQDEFNTVFRHFHTLKGNARGFGINLLSQSIHKSESDLEEIKSSFVQFNELNRELLLKELLLTKDLLDYYIKVAKEVFSISIDNSKSEVLYKEVHKDNLESLGEAIKFAMRGGGSHQNTLEKISLEFDNLLKTPIKDFLKGFEKVIFDTAKGTGKIVDFKVLGENIYITDDVLALLNDSLIHLLRNSVDHGIEAIEDRVSNNKNRKGTITIDCIKNGSGFYINIKDDGAGMCAKKIAEKAIEKKIIDKNEIQSMGEEEKLKLIFKSGFSTKENATELSGRGVGMDVVLTNVLKLGGDVKIRTEKGRGTEFSIYVAR